MSTPWCADPVDQATLGDVARANGVPFTGLWLEASLDTLTTRLNARVGDASDATPEIAARQLARRRVPSSWVTLNATDDAESVWRAARQRIDGSE